MAKPKTNPNGRGCVIHLCAKLPEGRLESLADKTGWDMKEVPLNSDKHIFCPDCKEPTDDMESAPGEQAMKLEKNIRAKGTNAGPVATSKAESAMLLQAITALREDNAKMRAQMEKFMKGGSK